MREYSGRVVYMKGDGIKINIKKKNNGVCVSRREGWEKVRILYCRDMYTPNES